MGLRTVPALLAITKDTSMHDRCRVLAGRILGRLALPQLQANLYGIINAEIERAYFYFYHWSTIQNQYPQYSLSILEDALSTGYHSVMDFIIQLLGVAGEIEDCELLSRCLRSRNPKIRSQVVEALEKTCETHIFRILQPLVMDLPQEEKISKYLKGGRRALNLQEVLEKMMHSPAQVDQIIAATLKQRLNMTNWREDLRKQMVGNEEIFQNFAYELLET
jgi:HEAT repeat protein